jgi:hypothetical protein
MLESVVLSQTPKHSRDAGGVPLTPKSRRYASRSQGSGQARSVRGSFGLASLNVLAHQFGEVAGLGLVASREHGSVRTETDASGLRRRQGRSRTVPDHLPLMLSEHGKHLDHHAVGARNIGSSDFDIRLKQPSHECERA